MLFPNGFVFAQGSQPEGPIYVVQQGDSLWDIAVRFGVALDDLARINNISDPSQLKAGTRLVIPGLENVQGEITTKPINFGDTLRNLSRRHQVREDILIKLNHITSPSELYAGSTLVIPVEPSKVMTTTRVTLLPGQSMFELAITQGATPWDLVMKNDLSDTCSAVPSEIFYLPGQVDSEDSTNEPSGLPGAIKSFSLNPLPFVQGKVALIQLTGDEGLSLSGLLGENELKFFKIDENNYASLEGIHAMTEPGLYTLVLSGTLPVSSPYFGSPFKFSQTITIRDGGYSYDPVITVSPETIDPAVTKPEDAQWAALASNYSPVKLWDGIFKSPAPEPYEKCWPSLFGSRRSYNGSAYIYFHSGLDFCGGVGTEILAPAAGKVVFAGPLTVRGNATMIDHGWGIFTGYLHQSEILVKVGEFIEPGQVIGLVGGTGRVTGPHLHWEIWAGGAQVDPMDWLEEPILS